MKKLTIVLSAASCFSKNETNKIKKLTDYAAAADPAWMWADEEDEYDTKVLVTIDRAKFGEFILDTIATFHTMVKVDDPIWMDASGNVSVRIVDDYDD